MKIIDKRKPPLVRKPPSFEVKPAYKGLTKAQRGEIRAAVRNGATAEDLVGLYSISSRQAAGFLIYRNSWRSEMKKNIRKVLSRDS